MKKTIFLMACACFIFACNEIQAQEKKKHGFLGFMEKVDKALEKTNQVLEDTNNALSGKVKGVERNGDTSVFSPTKEIKLEFKDAYVEGYDLVVNMMITNTTNEEIGLHWGEGTAWDNEGGSYDFGESKFIIGGDEVGPTGVTLPESIPLKASIRLKNVAKSNATKITKLKINTYQYKGFEVRNIPIIREEETSSNNSAAGEENAPTANKILSPTRNLKLQFKECYAENNNTVRINFMITNVSGKDMELNGGNGRSWDDQGESHSLKSITIGGEDVNSMGIMIPADIPLKGSLLIEGISKDVKEIKLVKFNTYQFKGFEIKNITVNRENI